jgi:hypothetical protein
MLVDELLARFGFSITYDEVSRYRQSASQAEELEQASVTNTERTTDSFVQWVADNVDHNTATLDGKGTFHGMGIIAVRYGLNGHVPDSDKHAITRLKHMRMGEVARGRGIDILHYIPPTTKALSKVILKEVKDLMQPFQLPATVNLDLVWQSGWLFRDSAKQPYWSGFMQHVCSGDHAPVSEVRPLPIIDLNPSDENCVFTTLSFVAQQTEKLNIETPCITFDQPLWLKATEIVQATVMNVFCRLGGFHMLMSFIGSVGSVMSGSGLSDVLEVIYGPNAVCHMLTGKAYARALRGYLLLDAALSVLLLKMLLPASSNDADTLPFVIETLTEEEVQQLTAEFSEPLDCVSRVS